MYTTETPRVRSRSMISNRRDASAAASELVRRGGRALGQTRQRIGRSGELAQPRVPKLVGAAEDGKDGA